MDESIEARLARLNVVLPAPAAPAANYVPFMRHEKLLIISGQLPLSGGGVTCRGRLGDGVTLEEGREAARLCAINILAQAKAALDGDLERIGQVLKITGFIASAPHFCEQHLVLNGASDFLAEALGPRGRHARAAVGTASLPMDAAVEVDAMIAVR
ncbi:MAG TPA: RidA family protein [Afifellaceae bacterium]|nr:RidA family protein [Afifellaceae bacterium]